MSTATSGTTTTSGPAGAGNDGGWSDERRPALVALGDARARDAGLVGAKAAALARAAAAGLPVLPGFVLTTAATAAGADRAAHETELRAAWQRLAGVGERPLVVRSSSTVEDGESTSMAGMFTSVLDVRGWTRFLAAVDSVLSSTTAVPGIEMAPMAVLVQPMLTARSGGVLFGADPVSGRTDRLVLAAVEGGPDQLVGGTVDGAQYLLSRRGRKLRADRPVPGLGRAHLRALASLARRVAVVFGGPQDVEWALDTEGQLRLLQSRPITAVAPAARPAGPVLGPGPVAETFPDQLAPLEEDLWVDPLRTAIGRALTLTGAATARQVKASPVVASVGGRVAADLALLGVAPTRHGFLARLDPRPPARRLLASWRVGRLGAALPGLVEDLAAQVDGDLLDVPPLSELDDVQLAGLLERCRQALVALNGYEVLAGLLAAPGATGTTGASLALRVLAERRAAGAGDDETRARQPVVLALVPPRIGPPAPLPPTDGVVAGRAVPPGVEGDGGDRAGLLREALRLRVRWLQELSARAAWELGGRLEAAGVLRAAGDVRHLRLAELDGALAGVVPADLADRRGAPAMAPLPAAFRMAPSGEAVAVQAGAGATAGRGAGGGRGTGRVHRGEGRPEAGAVLVVRTLDPGLAATLPRLGGLVAETGSVLSHLAILAREFGIPTAVGVPDALRRFPPGATVLVDGSTGEVTVLEAPAPEDADRPGDDAAGHDELRDTGCGDAAAGEVVDLRAFAEVPCAQGGAA